MPLPLDMPGRPDERVLRQLVAALLYEGVLQPTIGGEGADRTFAWTSAGTDCRCRGSIGAFGRIRIAAGSIEARGPGGWAGAALTTIVDALPTDALSAESLLAELEQTIAFCRRNAALPPRGSRRDLGFSDLEGALDEGHPYHPSFKARTGFSPADHDAYGPEAGQSFQLVWIAVDRRRLHMALPVAEDAFWLSELGAPVFRDLQARRAAAVVNPAAFGLLPLHPWQWHRLKEGALAGWLADGTAHGLGPAGDRYRASQSVRTLMNVDDPERANIKLAMDMVNTSARRTIEPHSVCSAPAISRWLAGVVAGDLLFEERYPLAILPEYAGIVADRAGPLNGPLAGQLAAIWRRSAESTLGAGDAAVPFNALMVVEADGRPFIDPWVRRFGLAAWLDRLVEVAVLPAWHLLVRHGIATEAHGQNMVLVHHDGWPARLVLRDFHDSVEFVHGFLADPARVPDFLAMDPAYGRAGPNAFYWMEAVKDLRDLMLDTIFVYNLTEVSRLLEVAYGLPEETFWQAIAARLARYAAEHRLEARQALLACTGPTFHTESLVTRKLRGSAIAHAHAVPNPLGRGPVGEPAQDPLMEGARR